MTQQKALEILKTGVNVFLTGEPGAGKTYTVNQFIEWCHENNKRVAVTASTGIAATHINGTTIHSFCAMGIKDTILPSDLSGIMSKDYAVDQMNNADVLIIDEISMLAAHQIDNIDMILRKVRGNGFEPFGGLQVIFVGDFYQLPPVPSRNPAIVTKFAFEALAWKDANLTICYLTEQHRQSDTVFLDLLSSIRNGTINEGHIGTVMACRENEKQSTVLFTHNFDVDRMNVEELAKVKGDERIFKMMDSGTGYVVDLLKKQCMSPEILKLKVGAVVMFTRNNFEAGYVNGTLGKVTGYDEDTGMPVVQTWDGQTITAQYAEWSVDDTHHWISQVPLRLAWAITVHKSQGMSLDGATIDLGKCFEAGQGYVALSRVRQLSGIHLKGLSKMAFKVHAAVVEKDKEFRSLSLINEK